MSKKILLFGRNVVFSSFLLYGYSLISSAFGVIIPINIFTVLLVSILGFPVILSLTFISIIMF